MKYFCDHGNVTHFVRRSNEGAFLNLALRKQEVREGKHCFSEKKKQRTLEYIEPGGA
jgi:hypothetical protein